MDNKKQDIIIYNILFNQYQKDLGVLNLVQYSESSMINLFACALNQSDVKNVKLKLKSYIARNWIVCGINGYIINPKLFDGNKL